jgi:hypothetical protein
MFGSETPFTQPWQEWQANGNPNHFPLNEVVTGRPQILSPEDLDMEPGTDSNP